jgi:hypothetical protein
MNTRQKGMILSKYIADQIISKGLDPKACADGGSGAGNREKADIHTSMLVLGQQAGIEAKNQKNINHKDSWRQTKKLEKLGCEPILAFKDFGEPLEETKVIIYLDSFLELVKLSQGQKPQPLQTNIIQGQRELAYALNNLKVALSKAIKLLE